MVEYKIHIKRKGKNKMLEKWLENLLKSKFFGPCSDHVELKKNERNVFCIDCNKPVCYLCLSSSSHVKHRLLQIRRYVYHDVVRLLDMQKYIDCSKVQTYTTNNAKVLFLNCRPLPKLAKSTSGASCVICERSVVEPNRYCSLASKISVVDECINQPSPPFGSKEEKSSISVEEEAESKCFSTEAESNPDTQNLRKRKRKGIPCRAPLF